MQTPEKIALSDPVTRPRFHPMPFQSEPTVIPAILLSDLAIVEQGSGKRSVIGSFDQFSFPQFPARYERFFITAWVSNLVGSLSELEMASRIEEKGSGHVIFSSSANLKFEK